MICRKAHVMLPEANFPFPDATFPSSRAQNRDFCALFAFGTLVFGLFEHKIGIFVSERAIFPWFLPLPSTKSGFLCAFCLRNPHFRAFRAQNRHFCVRNGDISLVLSPFEHKIGIFVRFCWEPDHRQQVPGGWQRVNGLLVPR